VLHGCETSTLLTAEIDKLKELEMWLCMENFWKDKLKGKDKKWRGVKNGDWKQISDQNYMPKEEVDRICAER
jgi:hypothetical protein